MKYLYTNLKRFLILFLFLCVFFITCKKIKEINYEPEIEPLQHGFKTSAAIGYCASLAYTFFSDEILPENVLVSSQINPDQTISGVLVISINELFPLPFNSSVGQITLAGIWGDDGGVITALFTDIDIINSKYEFKGIHTVPVIKMENGNILTMFAKQDIIVGNDSDTLLELSMGMSQINNELDRLKGTVPIDVFAAIDQNVWFVSIDQDSSASDIYDDVFTINGGGQIVEVSSSSGGLLYHSMINAKVVHNECMLNPLSGVGFIQNLKAGEQVDLGHIFLNFHENCDGKAYVEVASGKYLSSTNSNINLNFY